MSLVETHIVAPGLQAVPRPVTRVTACLCLLCSHDGTADLTVTSLQAGFGWPLTLAVDGQAAGAVLCHREACRHQFLPLDGAIVLLGA